jgi:ABC-type antimicrobial peptide transport system permease subunit
MRRLAPLILFFFLIVACSALFNLEEMPLFNHDMEASDLFSSSYDSVSSSIEKSNDYQILSDQINATYFDNIMGHINNLSQFGSRVTGYPGYEEAATYIKDYFDAATLEDVEFITYPLLVPLDLGSSISVDDKNYTAFTFEPNSVHTCQIPDEGFSGLLVYGGTGEFSDLDGKIIADSIVVLEFNSQDNWINAASLGAKGVIFLNPENGTTRFEAEDKSIDTPLFLPRLYIDNITTSNTIRTISSFENQTATIFSNMKWTSVEAKNVVGYLPGSSDDLIIISAYFDSSSVVPGVAPGADQACGISTLLELIRLIKENNITSQNRIMFLALSGHHQSAAGAREFVFQHYDLLNRPSGIKLFISLDLSSTNNKVGINPYGYLYRFILQFTTGNNIYNRLRNVGEDYLLDYAEEIKEDTGYQFEVQSYIVLQGDFQDIAPITFVGDQEPFVASNVLGLSLYTAETHRLLFDTPIDLPSEIQQDKLKSQVVYSMCALSQLITEDNLNTVMDLKPKSFNLKHTTHVGFATIEGYCKVYNDSTGWYTNVPNAIIKITSTDTRSGVATSGIYSYITQTDEIGYYSLRGVSSSQPDSPLKFKAEGYGFDEKGNLVKSMNLGPRGSSFNAEKTLTRRVNTINPTIFESGTIALFGVNHPYSQEPVAGSVIYKILDSTTRSPFFSYGFTGVKSVSIVFLEPNISAILVGELPDGVLAVYMTNSDSNTLRGKGFTVGQGEFKNLGNAAFVTSTDLQAMTQIYVDQYTAYNIYDALVADSLLRAKNLISTANTFFSNQEYSRAISTIRQVQTWSYDSFKAARQVIEDGTSTTIFFAILLLPFSFALASLLFNFDSGMKKIIATSLVYGLTLFIFYLIHPGLHLSSNISMVILGIIAIIFVFPALYMIYSEGFEFLKNLRVKLIGMHFADTSRSSTILIAMSTGISRMKKRKGRTVIALSGIILITFSLTLFTSASTQVSVFTRGVDTPTPYDGVFFRTKDWSAPLSEQLLVNLQVEYSEVATFSSRWWLYPASTWVNGYVQVISPSTGRSWEGWSILGLSPEETQFQPISTTLRSGSWFNRSDLLECILTEFSADQLDVNVNDTVVWAGTEFKVIGILDSEGFDDLKDFDNEAITPKNNHASSTNVHIRSNQTFIIPSDVAKMFGASMFSISMLADDTLANDIAEVASSTFGRYLEIRIGSNDYVAVHKRVIQNLGQGIAELGIPLTIAILLMVNTSISTVYESKKEIAIFTSLGLAPFHIAGLFLAEFLVYAVIGSVIGYLAGITSAVLLSAVGLFPESLAINYSSGSVINALGLGIAGILLSTIYPLRISAKISVPSVKRSWELKTKPEDDGKTWKISVPFVAASEQEARGILEFLREFFIIFESESVGGVFFSEDTRTREVIRNNRNEKHLLSVVSLAPFDFGLKQRTDLFTYLDEKRGHWIFEIDLLKTDGILSAWETSVRRFVDTIRKQLLIWRSLSKEDKAIKAEQFKENVT